MSDGEGTFNFGLAEVTQYDAASKLIVVNLTLPFRDYPEDTAMVFDLDRIEEFRPERGRAVMIGGDRGDRLFAFVPVALAYRVMIASDDSIGSPSVPVEALAESLFNVLGPVPEDQPPRPRLRLVPKRE